MTTELVEAPAVGETITRSVLALCGYHRIDVVKDLAPRIGMARHTMYRRIDRGNYTVEELAAIAAVFGVTSDDLLTGDLRLSREHDSAGQGPFSGSDIDALLDAVERQQHRAAVA